MLIISSERTLDMDEEFCVSFVHWMNTIDCANWTKLIMILKGTVIVQREIKFIGQLYMDHSVKIKLDQGETRSGTIGGEDRVG
jgi:hypothetical protein